MKLDYTYFNQQFLKRNQARVTTLAKGFSEEDLECKKRFLETLSKKEYLPVDLELKNTLDFIDKLFKKDFTETLTPEFKVFDFMDKLIEENISQETETKLKTFESSHPQQKEYCYGKFLEQRAELAARIAQDLGKIGSVFSSESDSQSGRRDIGTKSQITNDDLGMDLIVRGKDSDLYTPIQVKPSTKKGKIKAKIELTIEDTNNLLRDNPKLRFSVNFKHNRFLLAVERKPLILKEREISKLIEAFSKIENKKYSLDIIDFTDLEQLEKFKALLRNKLAVNNASEEFDYADLYKMLKRRSEAFLESVLDEPKLLYASSLSAEDHPPFIKNAKMDNPFSKQGFSYFRTALALQFLKDENLIYSFEKINGGFKISLDTAKHLEPLELTLPFCTSSKEAARLEKNSTDSLKPFLYNPDYDGDITYLATKLIHHIDQHK